MADESDAEKQQEGSIEIPPIPKETAGAVAGAAVGSNRSPGRELIQPFREFPARHAAGHNHVG